MATISMRRLAPCLLVLALLIGAAMPVRDSAVAASPPRALSYFGMNLYLTKLERLGTGDNLPVLATTARNAGVRWTREEFTWEHVEPSNNSWRGTYDGSVRTTYESGFGIIGMLLTTPRWARDAACTHSYWCPPANVNEYAQYAAWMVERYDGDGIADAPGSPRIDYWELWNEPNDTALWHDLGSDPNARKRRYGEMMVAAYQAIKAADPSARVLFGGVYVFDGVYCGYPCDGLKFLGDVFQLVPAARHAFDVASIHPYIPTARPDQPGLWPVVTVEGRVRNTRNWLNNTVGRSDAPIWISEMAWCTEPGACPGDTDPNYDETTEDEQANYLVRSMVIAQHSGVQHTSWFQFEDAFNDPNRVWANSAIVRQYDSATASYPPKPAYQAYRVLAARLDGAAVAGTGPVHSYVYKAHEPYGQNNNGTYDYRYTRGDEVIDVLWRPVDSLQVAFPVIAGKRVFMIGRGGVQTELTPSNGVVHLTLSERPIYIVQTSPPRLSVQPTSIALLAQRGQPSTWTTVQIRNAGGGTLTWSASTATGWLSLSPGSGTAPSTLRVTANTKALAVGTYNGQVTVSGASGAGSANIPVKLKVVNELKRVYLPHVRR